MNTPDNILIKQALAALRRATFLTSAAQLHQCPEESGSEVAFAGRSNAGKSSCINTLTDNRHLARTSKTPGRTQLINFFSLGRYKPANCRFTRVWLRQGRSQHPQGMGKTSGRLPAEPSNPARIGFADGRTSSTQGIRPEHDCMGADQQTASPYCSDQS
jgi:hypothetical protein